MKKIVIMFFLFVCIFLVGCDINQEKRQFEKSIEEYEKSIPKALDGDYRFPTLDNFSLQYSSTNSLFEDSLYIFPDIVSDTSDKITIKYSQNGKSISKEYLINLIFLTEGKRMKNFVDDIPSKITGNFALPKSDIFEIEYHSNEMNIINDIIEFEEKNNNKTLSLQISFLQKNDTKIYNKPIKFIKENLTDIPRLNISVNKAIDSKEEYIEGKMSIFEDKSGNMTETLSEASVSIRGRGNSTWYMPKKPYRLKFNEAIQLFDLTKSKNFTLLANFADQSLIRNAVVYDFADKLSNLAYTPKGTFVSLYINSKYQGNYYLCDQVEVANNKIDIEEKSSEVDTGYFIEFDLKLIDGPEGVLDHDYFYVNGQTYAIKSPKTDKEYYSTAQLKYIKSFITETEEALRTSNYDDYIDVDSFVDFYIVQELFKNYDVGHSSVYFYKDKGGKIKMGPVWDFDLAAGNHGLISDKDLLANDLIVAMRNRWYDYLMKDNSFKEKIKIRYQEIYELYIDDMLKSIIDYSNTLDKSAKENFALWDVIGKNDDWYTADIVLSKKTYFEQIVYLYEYMADRSHFLYIHFNKF